MTVFIKIQNVGEIDSLAFKLIGASTKRNDDTKIGFFGSGNKYALSLLLRKNIYFKIFSGKKEIEFGKKPIKFRDQQYEMVTINGEDTSMTTDMGPDWEEWFIIREFYCNAIDEGEATLTVTDKIEPEDGKTTIYIEKTQELSNFFSNVERYILPANQKYRAMAAGESMGDIRILPAFPDEFICYRKDIRVNEKNNLKSLYRYNFEKIEINESRIIKYEGNVWERIGRFFAQTNDKDIILNYLKNWKGNYEENAQWYWCGRLSPAWHQILDGTRVFPENMALHCGDGEVKSQSYIVPNKLAEKIAEEVKTCTVIGVSKGQRYEEVIASTEQTKKIETARTALVSIGYIPACPIVVADFYERDVGACYDNQKRQIVFAQKILKKNDDELKAILLEEFFHSIGYADASRTYEQFLLSEIIESKEKYVSR